MARTLGLNVTDEEHAALMAEAEELGISASLLMYRRIFNKPDARRRAGRPRKKQPEPVSSRSTQPALDDEERWAMTG